MSIAGKISISLGELSSGTRQVDIHSDRRTDIARVLIGMQPAEAASLLPTIFSICGCAHASAAAMACFPSGSHKNRIDADHLIVLCENAREHLLRIFTGWGDHVSFKPEQVAFHIIMGLVGNMRRATEIQSGLSGNAIRQVAGELDDLLKSVIFGIEPDIWLAKKDDGQLLQWAESTETVAARFILNLYDNNWQSIGSGPTRFLPDIPLNELSKKMFASEGDRFVNQPQWRGKTFETGPFARNQNHHLVKNLVAKYGSGLLARQIARLVELAQTPLRIIEFLEQPPDQRSSQGIAGIGQVETARGQLTHAAKITGGKISDYKILAPTEWNFHPRGVVHDALKNLQSENRDETKELARLIVEAIDPCVEFEVGVS